MGHACDSDHSAHGLSVEARIHVRVTHVQLRKQHMQSLALHLAYFSARGSLGLCLDHGWRGKDENFDLARPVDLRPMCTDASRRLGACE